MSAKEVYARGTQAEGERDVPRPSGRRFVVVLTISILLLFALTVGGWYLLFRGRLRHNAPAQNPAPAANASAAAESWNCRWKIAGGNF